MSLSSRSVPKSVDKAFDVVVQTEPLQHVTKHRIKNKSRKRPKPSSEHLKRNLISGVQTWDLESQSARFISDKRHQTTTMDTSVKLKLPPPPVPKKPRMKLANAASEKEHYGCGSQHSPGRIINTMNRKPEIPPKPVLSRPASLLLQQPSLVHEETLPKLKTAGNNGAIVGEGSPSKEGLSFSERLKASSLARRKDMNGQEGLSNKLMSHISPMRRGSRTFMNTSLSPEKDFEMRNKPPTPLFKRYSSESLMKSNLDIYDENDDSQLDLEEFEKLSLTPVEPLHVNSVFSPSQSFDEEDIPENDSFGSDMLKTNFDDEVVPKLMEPHNQSLSEVPKNSLGFAAPLNLSASLNLTDVSTKDAEGFPLADKDTDIYPSKDSTVLNNKDQTIQQRDTDKHISELENIVVPRSANSQENESKLFYPKVLPDDNLFGGSTSINPINVKASSSTLFSSSKKLGIGAKDRFNARRKFKPVGVVETATNDTTDDSNIKPKNQGLEIVGKESPTLQDIEIKKNNVIPVDDTLSTITDSSLEHVTQDIELDSSFDIRLDKISFHGSIENSNAIVKNDGTDFKRTGNSEIDGPIMIVEPEFIVPKTMATTEKINMLWENMDEINVENENHLPSEIDDQMEQFLENIESAIMEDAPVDMELSLDVEMLPIVPPPPFEEDDDSDMTFSILDLPSVYHDNDDVMETEQEFASGKEFGFASKYNQSLDDGFKNLSSKTSSQKHPRIDFEPDETNSYPGVFDLRKNDITGDIRSGERSKVYSDEMPEFGSDFQDTSDIMKFVEDNHSNVVDLEKLSSYEPFQQEYDEVDSVIPQIYVEGETEVAEKPGTSYLSDKMFSVDVIENYNLVKGEESREQDDPRFVDRRKEENISTDAATDTPGLANRFDALDDQFASTRKKNSGEPSEIFVNVSRFGESSEDENLEHDIPLLPPAPLFNDENSNEPSFHSPVPEYDSESSASNAEISDTFTLEADLPIAFDDNLSGTDGVDDLSDCIQNMSEGGREKRKFFTDRKTLPKSFDSQTGISSVLVKNDSLQSNGEVIVQTATKSIPSEVEIAVIDSSELSSGNVSPERKISANSFDKNVFQHVSLNFSSNSCTDNLDGGTSNVLIETGYSTSNGELSPITRKRQDSFLDEMLDPEPNKLSPWSSFENLHEPGKHDRRTLSNASSEKSFSRHDNSRRLSSDRRWSSSFCSTSDDEHVEEKVNIVQLMRERTINKEDFGDTNDVQIDFKAEHESSINGEIDDESDIEVEIQQFEESYDSSRFENAPLDDWMVEDVSDWLEMIGFSDLQDKFRDRNIDGRKLLAIDFQLLDDMGINNIDDRELILSEIYALKNPEDVEIEMSLLDALDNVSGYDREKMLAVLEALKMSSDDHENRYLPAPPSPKISARGTKKSPKSKSKKENYRRAVSDGYSSSAANDEVAADEQRSKSVSPRAAAADLRGNDFRGLSLDSSIASPKKGKHQKNIKTPKKKSFLREAFSFRRNASGRIARLFGSRKKLVDSSLKYLLQASPQGIVKIWTNGIGCNGTEVSLLVTTTTTAVDATKAVLEKLELIEDVHCYYLVQSHISKSVPDVALEKEDRPLEIQCRWPDAERYKFELKKKSEGLVIVVFAEQNSTDERSVKVDTTTKTSCLEIMSIALKKLQIHDSANSFSLYRMKTDRQGKRQTLNDSQIPMDAKLLKMAPSISKPAVFRLVRVNFLGSPEKTPFQFDGQKHKIEQLENDVQRLKQKLDKSEEKNGFLENELEETTESNFELKKRVVNQDERLIQLQETTTSLTANIEHQKEQLESDVTVKNGNLRESLLSEELELRQKDYETQRDIIISLELICKEKDEQIGNLLKSEEDNKSLKMELQRVKNFSSKFKETEQENEFLKIEIHEMRNVLQQKEEKTLPLGNDELKIEIHEARRSLSKLKTIVEENEVLGQRIEKLEEDLEKRKVDSLQRETQLLHENQELRSAIEEIKRDTKTPRLQYEEKTSLEEDKMRLESQLKDMEQKLRQNSEISTSLQNLKNEKEVLRKKLRATEQTLAKKNEDLEKAAELSHENEGLQDQVTLLGKKIKQKEMVIANASNSQKEIIELRKRTELLSHQVAEKTGEIGELRHTNEALQAEFLSESASKDQTIDNMFLQSEELKRQLANVDKEKRELRVKLKDIEQKSFERKRQIDEMNDIHDEYKGQHQRIKKLERELTMRTDELQKVHQEKELSTEDLQNHAEVLEQKHLEKDSKIIDMEFKMQKLERRLRESEDSMDDETREKNRLTNAYSDVSQMAKDLSKRVDDYKRLVGEKDKIIQTLKGSQIRTDEKLRKDLASAQRNLLEKESTIAQIKEQIDFDKMDMATQNQNLQELLNAKETKWKEREMRILKEREPGSPCQLNLAAFE